MRHNLSCGHIQTEKEYFHRRDAELIETIRIGADVEEKRRLCLAEACKINDPKILEALEELGYYPSTVSLLDLVPLLQVAWVDGSVSHTERAHILAIASSHGVKHSTPAQYQLLTWLDVRPSEEFFDGTLSVIRAALERMHPDDREIRLDTLLGRCIEVAAGSALLLHHIPALKRKLLEKIQVKLEPCRSGLTSARAAGR